MITIRKKWQIILPALVFQMLILNFIDILFLDVPKILYILSNKIGLVAFILVLAPSLRIYEYKEDKEKKQQLQKFCNVLSTLKSKKEQN
ncbi:hypothetical protein [Aliarcobacter butzleri]|uniref:hypothetical protein n=1 Tax=Aliarcobacter butzleri TaxID=28197 RepID=UPI001269AD2B|nr:hypothetical protein [Aliarcobacter butzleri]